ncbi:pancreatic triacylglycerol lipase-like [Uranotaenia lowii]|uniref:pancreatic triacylglycerol lipase-like n=1 Tax=Uranotaenia lowii TaxID=190385 RepID=UPI00247A1906|nr:pancreatic triacylglycerol lipase-like [Uranotaenia lowii]
MLPVVLLLFNVVIQLHGSNFWKIVEQLPDETQLMFEKHFYYDHDGRVYRIEGDRNPPDQPDAADVWLADNFVPDDDGRMYSLAGDFDYAPFFDAERDTVFRLYTRDSSDYEILRVNDTSSIIRSRFNVSHPTRFTIHGFGSNGDGLSSSLIRDQYFVLGEFNVVVVDWSGGSGLGMYLTSYFQVRRRVAAVGKVVSQLIDTLVQATEISLNEISIVGFSLGAHIAGNAGKAQSGRIRTIIGLDPARLLFSEQDSDILSSQDAQYVEVLHTSSFGYPFPIGTSDFYANGGVFYQPGCFFEGYIGCSHSRAYFYYAESITSQVGFWARKCAQLTVNLFDVTCDGQNGTMARMGGEPPNTETDACGSYQFETNSAAPFAKGR